MDLMPLRLNSSSLTCSICALAAIILIILQWVAMECQKFHTVDSLIEHGMTPIRSQTPQKSQLHLVLLYGSLKLIDVILCYITEQSTPLYVLTVYENFFVGLLIQINQRNLQKAGLFHLEESSKCPHLKF